MPPEVQRSSNKTSVLTTLHNDELSVIAIHMKKLSYRSHELNAIRPFHEDMIEETNMETNVRNSFNIETTALSPMGTVHIEKVQ